MTDVLYRWPAAAKFGRRVPKEKLYAAGSISSAARERFVTEVQQINWAYKLAENTINLPATDAVPEIQIFQIEAKGEDVSEPVLAAIDKSIQFPIVFEISRGENSARHTRMVAAHKQVGSSAPKQSAYYSTAWLPHDAERQPLPTAITMPALYAALLNPLLPLTSRVGEDLSAVAVRLQTIQSLEREIASLERKLRNEPQLNRKIELRRTLKTRQQELEQQR